MAKPKKSSTAEPPAPEPCPIEPVVGLVFGRWTSVVLWTLNQRGSLRFNELREEIPEITPKVLTERLRRLERDGFITRSYYQEVPPRVEYAITPLGLSLVPVFRKLEEWSRSHLDEVATARRDFDASHYGDSNVAVAGGLNSAPR